MNLSRLLATFTLPLRAVASRFLQFKPFNFVLAAASIVVCLGLSQATLSQDSEGSFLDLIENQRQLQEEIIRDEVESGISSARAAANVDPADSLRTLKLLAENVQRAPDLAPAVRAAFTSQIESAIREAARLEVQVAEQRATAQANQAAALERERLLGALARRDAKVTQFMARFNSLMEEGRYREAEDQIGYEVRTLVGEDNVLSASVVEVARLKRAVRDTKEVVELRNKNFVEAMFSIEKSQIPFPDEPPIVYPDAEVWEELSLRRKKYASIDLARRGGAEERIFAALEENTQLEFLQAPLSEVLDYLEDIHSIPIEINTRALDDAGLDSSIPITKELRGVSLRSALRLMLKELELTYVIRDEVLLITTPEDAESNLITKVYPVADLVLPISNGAGANPFQLGGGLGGQGGFGGGLGGNLGGGNNFNLNGNNNGFGVGGQFALDDELKLGGKRDFTPVKETTKETEAAPARPSVERVRPANYESQAIELNTVRYPAKTWDEYFANHQPEPEAVRATVRKRIKAGERHFAEGREDAAKREFLETNELIYAALRHGYPQPWMYEALGLSLELIGAPEAEIERALMSAVDFSDNPESLLHTANYLARRGFDKRALKLYQELATLNPYRPEPYVSGLALALSMNDVDGKKWATLGILGQAWQKEQAHVERSAINVAKSVLAELRKSGKEAEAKEYEAALNRAIVRDCYVRVTWTGEADVDLLVEEPSGTICSINNPVTSAGGLLVGDSFARTSGSGADGYSETYYCSRGFKGEYRVLLRRVWGEVTAGKVTIDIYTNFRTKAQTHFRKQIPIGEKDALVIFKLDQGRREESLESEQIVNLSRKHESIAREVVTRALATTENSEASRDYAEAWKEAKSDGRVPSSRPARRAVGYRPVITTLPEGTNMTATAVISADRRYVRITAIPLFSGIGDVLTFNTVDGEVGDGDGDGDDDDDDDDGGG